VRDGWAPYRRFDQARRAEHALRPAVVTRKVCGGNRSARGAETHAVLASVLRTIQQRQLDAGDVFSELLRSREPVSALAPPTT
jgi:transposase